MKKRKFLGAVLIASLCASMGISVPTMADGRRVVTLGVDLSAEQQSKILKYFGVTKDSVDLIYINNQQEREALGAYVPLERIGTHTYSCAMVSPVSTGGIQVKTANLDYVTCNMIASTLSTSGVSNCQVLAAAPFKVSGTGALTGIIMAYEQAANVTLDPVKKDLANEELIVTGNLADKIGQSAATAIVNEAKSDVIEGNVTEMGDITNIVNNITNDYNVEVNNEDKEKIAELMQKIAEQDYDMAQIKANLDKVQANVVSDTQASKEKQEEIKKKAEESAAEAMKVAQQALELAKQNTDKKGEEIEGSVEVEDSILDNTDVSALEGDGSSVIEGDTNKTVEEQKEEEQGAAPTDDTGIPEATGDTFMVDGSVANDDGSDTDNTDAGTQEIEGSIEVGDEGDVQEYDGSIEVTPETPVDEGTTEDEVDAPYTDDTEMPEENPMGNENPLSEEDYLRVIDVKEKLTKEFEDAVINSEDGVSEIYLTDEAAENIPIEISKYMVLLSSRGLDAMIAEEDADETISKTIVADTEGIVPEVKYSNDTLAQLDKYVRRVILTDSQGLLAECDLSDSEKAEIFKVVMNILKNEYESKDELEGTAEDEVEVGIVGVEEEETPENADVEAAE